MPVDRKILPSINQANFDNTKTVNKMNVLVVGGGGREHAMAWKLKQSPRADRVFVAPGNAGTAVDAENVDIAADDIPALLNFAKENNVGLTVVGPEVPLCDGIVDVFEEAGLKIFGPAKNAARLEASKVFCKQVLRASDVPTADFSEFSSAEAAERFINERYEESPDDCPVVVKADGLAAGKGAIVCSTRDEALEAIDLIARQREFGSAGDKMIIEDRLEGVEASILAITDGKTILTLPPAEDHKRAHDGDAGPNTGGMGAYCPTPSIDDEMLRSVEANVLVPTVHHLKRQRSPFRGILYAGLMLTSGGPKVLEYNVRFGDPECQPMLLRLKTDLLDLLEATVDQRLAGYWTARVGRPASGLCRDGVRGLPRQVLQRPRYPWARRSREDRRCESFPCRHQVGCRWQSRQQRRSSTWRDGGWRHRFGGEASSLQSREVHSLGRRLVP